MKAVDALDHHTRARWADFMDRLGQCASGLILGAALAGGRNWTFAAATGVVVFVGSIVTEAIVRPSQYAPHLCATARSYRQALDDIAPLARQAKDDALGVTDDLVRQWVKASP